MLRTFRCHQREVWPLVVFELCSQFQSGTMTVWMKILFDAELKEIIKRTESERVSESADCCNASSIYS